MIYGDVLRNYAALTERIAVSKKHSLFLAPSVVLIAVTKQQPTEKIKALLDAGHCYYGENRVNDAEKKWISLKKIYPATELHLIGGLQTNKVRAAVALFDVIETLDRIPLADALEKEAAKQGKIVRCMIQVNIGAEPQKSGVVLEELHSLYMYTQKLLHVRVEGLMCIPPESIPPQPYFALMREWQARLGLPYLSMGMSGDFAEAIREGATHVRIGTALMGEREGKELH
jgi:PLP dependent protein